MELDLFLADFPPHRREELRRIVDSIVLWLGYNTWARIVFPSDERLAAAIEAVWVAETRAQGDTLASTNPIGWRITTAQRYLLDQFGRCRRNQSLATADAESALENVAARDSDPVAAVMTVEILDMVQGELDQLAPGDRRLVGWYLDGETYTEISRRCGHPYHQVRTTVMRILAVLRARLGRMLNEEEG